MNILQKDSSIFVKGITVASASWIVQSSTTQFAWPHRVGTIHKSGLADSKNRPA